MLSNKIAQYRTPLQHVTCPPIPSLWILPLILVLAALEGDYVQNISKLHCSDEQLLIMGILSVNRFVLIKIRVCPGFFLHKLAEVSYVSQHVILDCRL